MGSCCSCFRARARATWDTAPAEIRRMIQGEARILYDDPIVVAPSSHAPDLSEDHQSIIGNGFAQYYGANTFCTELRGLSPPEIDYKIRMMGRWVVDCGLYARYLNKIEICCYSQAQMDRAMKALSKETALFVRMRLSVKIFEFVQIW